MPERKPIWDSLTEDERRGIGKVVADLDEPSSFTADELRELADTMDWLAEGPLRVGLVEIGGDYPWAWVHKHPSSGPTVQVMFQRPVTNEQYRAALLRHVPEKSDAAATTTTKDGE